MTSTAALAVLSATSTMIWWRLVAQSIPWSVMMSRVTDKWSKNQGKWLFAKTRPSVWYTSLLSLILSSYPIFQFRSSLSLNCYDTRKQQQVSFGRKDNHEARKKAWHGAQNVIGKFSVMCCHWCCCCSVIKHHRWCATITIAVTTSGFNKYWHIVLAAVILPLIFATLYDCYLCPVLGFWYISINTCFYNNTCMIKQRRFYFEKKIREITQHLHGFKYSVKPIHARLSQWLPFGDIYTHRNPSHCK